MHLTLSCHQRNTFGDLLEHLMTKSLERALKNEVQLRKSLPVDYMNFAGQFVNNLSKQNEQKKKKFAQKVKELALKALDHMDIDSGKLICD